MPAIINWKKEIRRPPRLHEDHAVLHSDRCSRCRALAAGQKQKLEICKQLYLKNKMLFLDEPTSVLTPGEADEVLDDAQGAHRLRAS